MQTQDRTPARDANRQGSNEILSLNNESSSKIPGSEKPLNPPFWKIQIPQKPVVSEKITPPIASVRVALSPATGRPIQIISPQEASETARREIRDSSQTISLNRARPRQRQRRAVAQPRAIAGVQKFTNPSQPSSSTTPTTKRVDMVRIPGRRRRLPSGQNTSNIRDLATLNSAAPLQKPHRWDVGSPKCLVPGCKWEMAVRPIHRVHLAHGHSEDGYLEIALPYCCPTCKSRFEAEDVLENHQCKPALQELKG
ncbi:hypothetical protein TWF281_006597 [Arthrobotrys megalospora]